MIINYIYNIKYIGLIIMLIREVKRYGGNQPKIVTIPEKENNIQPGDYVYIQKVKKKDLVLDE